jgi:crotonobetainyl-CoA:carnitine CoA-transferase CaiB-like acyl-CoA transferase
LDALEGLTVLDLTTNIAGPYATKVLADLGARVIKIEPPGGDVSRALGPFLGDQPGPERSATYQFLNTNKQSVVLELESTAGREALQRLLPLAGLVVESFAPADSERLGLGYEAVRAVKDIPVLSITNFGRSGPYRDYQLSETVLYAMGGEMFSHGNAAREPLKIGGTGALLQCGAMGAIAALGAIHAYEQHGIGQQVDVALFDVQICSIDRRSSAILAYRWTGRNNVRPEGGASGAAGGVYPCADGYVEVTASSGNYWKRFAAMIGDPALQDPKWDNPAFTMSPQAKEESDGIVYPWMLSRTKLEVWEAARKQSALIAPLFAGEDLLNDPVLRERGLWTEVEHAVLGTLPMLGRPYILAKTPWRVRQAAPMLGEHTAAVLSEAGLSPAEIGALAREGVPQ